MNIIRMISQLFKKSFNKENDYKQLGSSELSIIDTSTLQIDDNMTNLEKEEYQQLVADIKKGDIATIITYGNDIAKKINGLMDIARKRINQNIEENKSFIKFVSTEDVINHKLKIIFNNAEIDNIIEELRELRRSCEIRVLALKNVGEEALRKSQRRINIFSNKYDLTRVNSINNAISRLSSSIKIISMLINSIQIELYNNKIENDAIDKYLENNDQNENTAVTNKVLKSTFEDLKLSLNAIGELSNEPEFITNSTPINEIDFDSLSLNSKIDIIAKAKKYLDVYVIKNKEDFFKDGGLFSNVNNKLNKLWEEIESDYYDWDLWAKKLYASKFVEVNGHFYPTKENAILEKYFERLESIEKIISVFNEEMPEDFIAKFYKTKFYYKALYYETIIDVQEPDSINKDLSKKERDYYIKFLTDIIERTHIESSDGELLSFMDKNLSIKDIDKILTDYMRFVALLRIEKYGRNGLFTLEIFNQSNGRNYSLDMLDRKSSSSLEHSYGTSSSLGLDILKLWKNTDRTNRFNCFFADYDNSTFVFKNDFTIPRDLLNNDIESIRNNEILRFIAIFNREINKKIRTGETDKDQESLWNSNTMYSPDDHPCSLAQFLAGFAFSIEKNNLGFTKEEIMEKLLQFYSIKVDIYDNISISQFGEKPQITGTDFAYYLTLGIFSNHYIEALQNYKNDENSSFEIIDDEFRNSYGALSNKIVAGFLENVEEVDDEQKYKDYIKFFEETERMVKDKIKQNSSKPKSEQLWNTEYIVSPSCKISLVEIITFFAKKIEDITGGLVPKEQIRNKILSYYSIRREGYSYTILKNQNGEEKKLELTKDNFYESILSIAGTDDSKAKDDILSNVIYEFSNYFINNMLMDINDLNKKDDAYRHIVNYISDYISQDLSEKFLKKVRFWAIFKYEKIDFLNNQDDYLKDMLLHLSAKGKANIFKFPKQSIEFILRASKDTKERNVYWPVINIDDAIKSLSEMESGEQLEEIYR